eukprot:sb/3479069/
MHSSYSSKSADTGHSKNTCHWVTVRHRNTEYGQSLRGQSNSVPAVSISTNRSLFLLITKCLKEGDWFACSHKLVIRYRLGIRVFKNVNRYTSGDVC